MVKAGHPKRVTGFCGYMGQSKSAIPKGMALHSGDPERTRTVDLQRDRLAC